MEGNPSRLRRLGGALLLAGAAAAVLRVALDKGTAPEEEAGEWVAADGAWPRAPENQTVFVVPLELLPVQPRAYRRWFLASDEAFHERLLAHPRRTLDPLEADLHYVPYLSSRHALWSLSGDSAAPRFDDVWDAVLGGLGGTRPWLRRGGRDHLWYFSMDYGACLSTERDRPAHEVPGAVRRGVVLSALGDLAQPVCFRPGVDLAAPPPVRASFVWRLAAVLGAGSDDELRAAQRLRIESRATTLVEEMPAEGRAALEAFGPAELVRWALDGGRHRSRLLWWRGRTKSVRGVRSRLLDAITGDQRLGGAAGAAESSHRERPSAHQDGMLDSEFCACPAGQAPWSPRLVESLLTGCIPVVLSDDIELPLDTAGVRWADVSVRVPEAGVDRLYDALAAVSPARRRQMRVAMARLAPRLLMLRQRLPGAWGERDGVDTMLDAAARRLWERHKHG